MPRVPPEQVISDIPLPSPTTVQLADAAVL